MTVEFSNHALRQMEERSIAKEIILSVIQQPDHKVKQDQSTTIFTKLIDEAEKRYLYRVFVNTAKKPQLIITAYKTSKIDKYGYSI